MDQHLAATTSPSGSDQAESEAFRLLAGVWRDLASGVSFHETVQRHDDLWRSYAGRQNAAVEGAGRIKSGPRAGQSARDHRWVSPENFSLRIIAVRQIASALGVA